MPVVQWLGIALMIISIAMNGAKEYSNIRQKYQPTSITQNDKFMYSTINIAYDVTTGKHWFMHNDGTWKEYPPRPF